MYEERKNKFSFKSFFLTLLLVILFVLLLLWLFPSKWDIKRLENIQTKGVSVNNVKETNLVSNNIFKDNIELLKESALSYFTSSKLPKDSIKLSLKEMYNKHLLLELKDKNEKSCDEEKSYVEVIKKDNEYEMKVNLKCENEEDYIIAYINFQNKCQNTTCLSNNLTSSETEPTGKVETIIEPEKKIYSCEIVNGIYYNKNGNNVSKLDYEKSCGQTASVKCQFVDGKYYDTNGNMVGKEDYEKLCNINVSKSDSKNSNMQKKYYCKNVNGKYYDKKGNVVSEGEYKKSCQ